MQTFRITNGETEITSLGFGFDIFTHFLSIIQVELHIMVYLFLTKKRDM